MRSAFRLLTAASALTVLISACNGSATPGNSSSAGPSTSPSMASGVAPREPSPSESLGIGPPACTEATFAYDPGRGALLLLNCVDQLDRASVEQIWSWDGATWDLVDDGGPPATVVAGVAFDPEARTVIRYGGLPLSSDDCVSETWQRSEAGWEELEADPPTACDHMFMTHDTARDVSLLFGGGDDLGNLVTETWTWDGSAWARVATGSPSGRAHFGFVWDQGHEQALLYGGYDGDRVFDDFWAWDGSAWSELDFPGPGTRSHFGSAAGPDGMILFGGATSPSTFASLRGDTWMLTNGVWSEVEGEGPSPRGSPALGYDEGRDRFVLFGGFDASGALLGDTWEWDDGWRCVAGC